MAERKMKTKYYSINAYFLLGCVTGYQVIRVIRIFAKTYPFEYQSGIILKNWLLDFLYLK